MPLSPEVAAILAKQLADIAGAFSQGNPTQEALSGILRDRVGGLVKATQFNRSQTEMRDKILGIINKAEAPPESGVGFGTPGLPSNGTQSALTVPGTPQQPFPPLTPSQFPEPKTLAEAGFAEPGRVDPLKALGMGQQGTQSAILLEQQNTRLVQQELDLEKRFKMQLDVIDLREQNRQRAEERAEDRLRARDVERGGPQTRQEQSTGRQLSNLEAAERLLRLPTGEQVTRTQAAEVTQEESAATIAEEKAGTAEETERLRLDKLRIDAIRPPGDISKIQTTAQAALTSSVMATLLKRLGRTSELNRLMNVFDEPASPLNEATRRFNFSTLVSMLEPNERRDFNELFREVEETMKTGGQPSEIVEFGKILGQPTPQNPSITPIDEISVQDAVQGALGQDDLLGVR